MFTAGLIVAAGTGALVVGELGFFRAFGPGLAVTTLIALAVSITLVPALLALFGARLFGAASSGDGPQGRCRPTRTPTRARSSARAERHAADRAPARRAAGRASGSR